MFYIMNHKTNIRFHHFFCCGDSVHLQRTGAPSFIGWPVAAIIIGSFYYFMFDVKEDIAES